MRRPPRRPSRVTPGLAGILAAVAALAVLAGAPGPAAGQETRALVVVGLGGSDEYRETFHRWAADLRSALVELGIPRDRTVYLGEDAGPAVGATDGESTREGLRSAVADMASEAGASDRILVVLIGHGTTRGDEARFNLPGPDISAAELGALLDGAFPTQTVAVVNTASASGPFVPALSGPGRVVLTATRSGREQNETRFGEFFVDALEGEGADLDKDGRLSLLEVFQYAAGEVRRHYEEQNLLLTEHALLDDDGDGEGSLEPGTEGSDGSLARSFYVGALGVGASAAAAVTAVPDSITDPELRRLYQERADLQTRIEGLRLRKDQMEAADYEAQLEELLIELALANREIQARGGGR